MMNNNFIIRKSLADPEKTAVEERSSLMWVCTNVSTLFMKFSIPEKTLSGPVNSDILQLLKDTLLVPVFDFFILWVVVRNDLCCGKLRCQVTDDGRQLQTLISTVDKLLVLQIQVNIINITLPLGFIETSSPKGNDRSPEIKQVFLNSSQVSIRFFSIGQWQPTLQSMVGPNSDINEGL